MCCVRGPLPLRPLARRVLRHPHLDVHIREHPTHVRPPNRWHPPPRLVQVPGEIFRTRTKWKLGHRIIIVNQVAATGTTPGHPIASRIRPTMGAGDRTDAEADDAMDMSAKRRAEVDALWANLNGGGGAPDASARAPTAAKARGRGGKNAAAGPSKGKAALGVLARLNRVAGGGVTKKGATKGGDRGSGEKALNDSDWRKALGLDGDANRPAPSKVSAEAVKEALAKAGGGVRMRAVERTDGVMTVKETRNFAGKEMEVTKTYAEGSKEAKQAAKRDAAAKSGGLDGILLQMEKTRKLNVLDKSKMDWKDVKEGDAEMEEDLEKHKRGKTYLEEQDFLKRAELREYELERDARLNADVRTRGRL